MLNSFAPLAWLVTFVVASCFAVSFYTRKSGGINWFLALAVAGWVLYSCWETFLIDPVKNNIRVDLLLIIPLLALLTLLGIVMWLRS